MAEDKIDSYIDRQGIRGDTDYILSALREVYSAYQNLQSIKIDLGDVKGLSNLNSILQQVRSSSEVLNAATSTVEKRISELNGRSKEFTQTLLTQTRAQKEAAQVSLLEAKTAVESAKAKNAEAKASKETVRAKEIEERLVRNLVKAKENINKEAIKEADRVGKLNNEYEQLKAKYLIAANTAKQLAAAKGIDNEETKEAINQAQKYYQSLIRIEQAVGQSQRNVGNYTQATFALTQVIREAPAFANSFATGISAISNNIPILIDQYKNLSTQIGKFNAFKVLAGSLLSFQALLPIGFLLLQSYGKEVANFFSSIFSGTKAFNAAKEAQKNWNAAMVESTKSAGSHVAELQALYEVSQNVTQSIDDRRKASQRVLQINKENNEATGENIRLTTDQNGVLKQQPELIDKISESLIRQAKTKAVLQLIEKAYSAVLEKQLETLTSQTNRIQDLGLKGLKVIDDFFGGGRAPTVTEVQKGLKEKGVKDAEAYLSEVKKILSEGLKTGELDFAGIFDFDKKKTDENSKKLKEAADKQLQTLTELKALELQRVIDFNNEIANNEEKSLFDRLTALRKAKDASEELIILRSDTEKKIGDKSAKELELIEAKKYDEFIRLIRKFNSDRRAIQDDELKKQVDYEKQLTNSLIKSIEEGYKRFQKAEEDRIKKQRELSEQRKSIVEEERKLYKAFYDELASTVTTFFTARRDREIASLRDQIDVLEAIKQKDIEVVNQTVANREQAAAQIAIIQARSQAQREQLEKRQRDIERQKANIEKGGQAAQIVGNTAQGVLSLNVKAAEARATAAVLAANPVTAPLAPQAFALATLIQSQIPFIIAIGAAQLARVLIPRFKEGKNLRDNYEGPAIVDDGGKPEAIIRENGSVEIGSNKPRLTFVRKNDVILPDANQLIDYVLAGNTGMRLKVNPGKEYKSESLEDVGRKIVSAIQNQSRLELKASDKSLEMMWKFGANRVKYINDQTNWD